MVGWELACEYLGDVNGGLRAYRRLPGVEFHIGVQLINASRASGATDVAASRTAPAPVQSRSRYWGHHTICLKSYAKRSSHLCHGDYETTLDDYVAMTFTVAAAVRRIRYHDPESLPLEDYFFTYKGTLEGVTEGGAPMMELMKSDMRGLARLAPNETSRLEFELEPGMLFGTVLDSDAFFDIIVEGERHAEARTISIAVRPGACEPSGVSVAPGPVVIEARTRRIAVRSSAFCGWRRAMRATACSPSGRSCPASAC